MKEEHDLPIYSVQFNYMDKRHRDMFATVGTNRVTVYRVDRESSDIQVLQAYHDSESQDLYTCAWTYNDENGHPMLLIGGDSARIKVLDITTRKVVKTLFGHGGAINELRVYPKDPNILLSASKDESVRLWNIKTKTCIAIFTGDEGHRDDVLSAVGSHDSERASLNA